MNEYVNFPGKELNVTIIQSNKFCKKNNETGFLVFLKEYIYIYIYIYSKHSMLSWISFCHLVLSEAIFSHWSTDNPDFYRESFENSCMQHSAYKCLIRKVEEGPVPGPQSHHVNCDICGKLCLSLPGLKSHLRKCAKSILHPSNVTANKTDQLWQNLLQFS